MLKNIKVSVVIPVYKRTRFLRKAIQSVLEQTYSNFEIILVDDNSNVSISNIIEKIIKNFNDSRIHYISHGVNRGMSEARNTGIRSSNGKYIAFLDTDDEWFPDKLNEQVRIFKNESKNLGAVYCGVTYIDEKGNNVSKEWIPEKKGNIYEDLLFKNCVGGCSGVIVKKECFNKVGLFDKNFPVCQDSDMWIRVAKDYNFCFAKKSLVRFRIHPEQQTKNHDLMIEDINRIQVKYVNELKKRPYSYSRRYFFIGNMLCHLGRIREGQSYLVRAIYVYPLYLKYYIYLFCSLFGAKGYKLFFNIKQVLKKFKNI